MLAKARFAVDECHGVMDDDVLAGTRALKLASAETPAQFEAAFDSFSYQKGACINRMMAHALLGEDTFFKGLRNVLHFYKYSNIKEEDLFHELTLVAHQGATRKKVFFFFILVFR